MLSELPVTEELKELTVVETLWPLLMLVFVSVEAD